MAIRAGPPLVNSGGEIVRLSGALSEFADALAKHYNKTRESILLEAIERGIPAVGAQLLYTTGKELPGDMARAMLDANPDAEPMRRVVREATRARGALQIQLDDLLQHCEEARERKEIVERVTELHRKLKGSWPKMWGSGVSTAKLKRQIAELEREAASGGAQASAAPPNREVPGPAAPRPVTATKPAPPEAAQTKGRQIAAVPSALHFHVTQHMRLRMEQRGVRLEDAEAVVRYGGKVQALGRGAHGGDRQKYSRPDRD